MKPKLIVIEKPSETHIKIALAEAHKAIIMLKESGYNVGKPHKVDSIEQLNNITNQIIEKNNDKT